MQPLLPKQKSPCESRTENHSHSKREHIHYTTMMVSLKWQTQHFIWTASCTADL